MVNVPLWSGSCSRNGKSQRTAALHQICHGQIIAEIVRLQGHLQVGNFDAAGFQGCLNRLAQLFDQSVPIGRGGSCEQSPSHSANPAMPRLRRTCRSPPPSWGHRPNRSPGCRSSHSSIPWPSRAEMPTIGRPGKRSCRADCNAVRCRCVEKVAFIDDEDLGFFQLLAVDVMDLGPERFARRQSQQPHALARGSISTLSGAIR